MAAHLHEAAIVATILADEDRLYRGLYVVVEATSAGALEQGERPVVGVKHHLLRLARITPHKQHPAVTEPDMGSLHHHRHAIQQNHLVLRHVPVEIRRAVVPPYRAPLAERPFDLFHWLVGGGLRLV